MTPFVTAGAGFLIAVLWFDLMFDLHARRRGRDLADPLAAVSAYYAHVTTAARPMNRLVALVMLATLAVLVAQVADGGEWHAWLSLGLVIAAFGIAGGRTVAAARRLGRRSGPAAAVASLAASIMRDHLVCLGLMSAVLGLQLGFA